MSLCFNSPRLKQWCMGSGLACGGNKDSWRRCGRRVADLSRRRSRPGPPVPDVEAPSSWHGQWPSQPEECHIHLRARRNRRRPAHGVPAGERRRPQSCLTPPVPPRPKACSQVTRFRYLTGGAPPLQNAAQGWNGAKLDQGATRSGARNGAIRKQAAAMAADVWGTPPGMPPYIHASRGKGQPLLGSSPTLERDACVHELIRETTCRGKRRIGKVLAQASILLVFSASSPCS
jgi:hypothetical protein